MCGLDNCDDEKYHLAKKKLMMIFWSLELSDDAQCFLGNFNDALCCLGNFCGALYCLLNSFIVPPTVQVIYSMYCPFKVIMLVQCLVWAIF